MSVSTVLPASPLKQALLRNPIPALRILEIEESDELVILSGSVSSYYLKQLAQEAVLSLVGRRRLLNRVMVHRETIYRG